MHSEDSQDKITRSFFEPELEFEVKRDLYQTLDHQSETAGTDLKLDPLYDRICEKIAAEAKQKKKQKNIRLIRYISTRAAIFLFGIFFYALILHPYFGPEKENEFTLIAPKNAIAEAILPDGSKIFLNANSKLRYRGDNQREVFLLGEAWFDVKKDAHRAFVVNTPGYKVLVHGTRFNVRAFLDNQQLVTTLQHGSVEILPLNGKQNLRPVKLNPGQQFIFDPATDKGYVSEVRAGFASLWKESEIRFENKSFRELLSMLEGRYNVRFVVKDQELFNYHYDGTIRDENLYTVLDILKQTLPFQYNVKDNGIIQIEK